MALTSAQAHTPALQRPHIHNHTAGRVDSHHHHNHNHANPGHLNMVQDKFEVSGGRGTETLNVRQHFQQQTQRGQTIRSLFKEGVGQPSAAQGQRLVNELSVIDNDVLNLVAQGGTKIAVADAGDNMQQLGLITPLTSEGLKARVPQMKEAGARLLKDHAALDKAAQSNQGLGEARNRYIDSALNGLDKGVTVYRSPAQKMYAQLDQAPPQMRAMMQSQLSNLPDTVPLEQLARSHGANTPAEVKEFTDLTRELNADSLPEMNKRGRASLQEQLKSDNPMKAQIAKTTLESQDTLVNWNSESLLVPDLNYHRPPGDNPFQSPDYSKPGIKLDSHDQRTVQDWGQGKMETLPYRTRENPHGTDMGGQYLKKTDTLLVQNGMESVAVHEVGHRVEDQVKAKDPEFYAKWNQQRVETYQRKRQAGESSVTDYAMADRGEYSAEGFSFYYEDPKLLKAKDPELYSLTEQLVTRARELGKK